MTKDILYLIFISVNLATFIYLMIKMEDRKGWIVFLPVCMVFGFAIAFIMIYDALSKDDV
jgi:hypothetical protein